MSDDAQICQNCGNYRSGHYLVNFVDRLGAAEAVMICPDAVFRSRGFRADGERKPVQPPGPRGI